MSKFEHPLSADSFAPPLLTESSQEQFSNRVRNLILAAVVVFVSVIVVLALLRVGEDDGAGGADYRFKAESIGTKPSAPLVKAPVGLPTDVVGAAPSTKSPVRGIPSVKAFTVTQAEQSMKLWVELWSARRTDDYLKLFDPSFPNRDAYVKNRAARIAAAKFIEVRIESPVFKELGNHEIAVEFIHHYRSDTFQSRDRKELVWRLSAEGPRIVRERNLPN